MINLLLFFIYFILSYLVIKHLFKKFDNKYIKNIVGYKVAQVRNIPEGLIYIIIIKELIVLVLSFISAALIYIIMDLLLNLWMVYTL